MPVCIAVSRRAAQDAIHPTESPAARCCRRVSQLPPGVLLSERSGARAGGPASRRHRRGLQRPDGGVRAVAGRLRRDGRRGAQPRRRPRRQLRRHGAAEERRGRRRADRVEPSHLGGLRQAVRARVPRRHAKRRTSSSRSCSAESASPPKSPRSSGRSSRTVGGDDERGRGARDRRRSAVDDAGRGGARSAHARVVDSRG